MENILAPSILSADFKILGEQIEQTEKAGAKYIHFDVMDGIFVPSISFGMPVLSALKGAVKQALDVHLMVTEPIRYVKEFAKCGADIITVHLEACEDVKATVDEIKASGVKAGITIKPATPVKELIPYLELADMFLIMSVEPGFGGQAFIPESLDKIKELRTRLTREVLRRISKLTAEFILKMWKRYWMRERILLFPVREFSKAILQKYKEIYGDIETS